MMQFGGLAFMPFALILMTEPHSGPAFIGPLAAMAAFLLTGLGFDLSMLVHDFLKPVSCKLK